MTGTRLAASMLALSIAASACASAPQVAPPPGPPPRSFEQKLADILRLEDQRRLRDPQPEPPPPPPPVRGRPAIVAPVEPPPPDLVRLLDDPEARVRRRAALAVGRVRLAEGVEPLIGLLADGEPEVRRMAAFALGLIGDRSARDPLLHLLADPSPLVQGSAAEALGLVGDRAVADAIGRLAAEVVQSGALVETPDEESDAARDTPAAVFRLAVFALARLNAFEPLAAAALDAGGQPKVRWWPLAYALQRLEDDRAVPALLTLAGDPHPYTRAFAAKGLGALRAAAAPTVLLPLVKSPEPGVALEAVRALGRVGDPVAAPVLLGIVQNAKGDPLIRAEAVAALASMRSEGVVETLLDVLADERPIIRAAALRALRQIDPEGFVFVLSGLDPDPHWTVRAALAQVLGSLPPDAALPRLRLMLDDPDGRTIPAVLGAFAALAVPEAAAILDERLGADDPVIRAAAATGLGALKPPGAVPRLVEAYRAGGRDASYVGRAAALAALAAYGGADAVQTLTDALEDPDWAIRVRAAALLRTLDASVESADPIRPAPTRHDVELYSAPQIVGPPYATQAYIETDRGTIQLELAVVDAPLTVDNFVTLARRGFYDGVVFHRVEPNFVVQGGDPRGDGEGGPGYTIRDELTDRPYVRGTLGMALDWPDTGGSQFFITLSPQPHLDARYTAFGRVLAGMEIVDQLRPFDVIRQVRVWDGETPLGGDGVGR